MGKVLVAMSGGVDSSVTAKLVHDAGHQCIGCTMRLYDGANDVDDDVCGDVAAAAAGGAGVVAADDVAAAAAAGAPSDGSPAGAGDIAVAAAADTAGTADAANATCAAYAVPEGRTCCTLEDAEDARSVAFGIGIPYYVFNFTDCFEKNVINRFVASYEKGWTPNPCIDCNRFLKFERLFDRAKELGCDYLATGHYVRIERDGGKYLLKKGVDETKDQSYVLYSMTQEQLAHTLFPLGGLTKKQVREIAAQSGFVTADKQESQDICFVPDGDYASFIRRRTHKSYPKGDFVDLSGNVVGKHQGIIQYTVGQRKGLGLALGEPVYVREIDAENNRVVVCLKDDLNDTALLASNFNWISGEAPVGDIRCKAKVRYRQREQAAVARSLDNGAVEVVFDQPQGAIALGQAVVLYDGDVVLGGGTIISVRR